METGSLPFTRATGSHRRHRSCGVTQEARRREKLRKMYRGAFLLPGSLCSLPGTPPSLPRHTHTCMHTRTRTRTHSLRLPVGRVRRRRPAPRSAASHLAAPPAGEHLFLEESDSRPRG